MYALIFVVVYTAYPPPLHPLSEFTLWCDYFYIKFHLHHHEIIQTLPSSVIVQQFAFCSTPVLNPPKPYSNVDVYMSLQ